MAGSETRPRPQAPQARGDRPPAPRRAAALALVLLLGVVGCTAPYHERSSPYVRTRMAEGSERLRAGDRAGAIAAYELAAATGDPYAEYRAAQAHAGGPSESRDTERAIELLRRTVSKASRVRPDAQILLARLIADDAPAEALDLMRQAEAAGASVPSTDMARLLVANGQGDEAERWLAEARAQGDVAALQLSVDQAIAAGDRRAAARYGTQLAGIYRDQVETQGKAASAWPLARLYDDDRALPRDVDEAIRWYTVAAEAGDVRGIRVLARGFLFGSGGFPVDPVAGRQWGERGAALDDAATQGYLGRAYLTGQPLAQDLGRGEALLAQAAAAGNAAAMGDLGRAYLLGTPLPRDVDRGVSLLETAAARGNASALIALGWAYWNGDGVPRDPERARALMREADALGHPSARRFRELHG